MRMMLGAVLVVLAASTGCIVEPEPRHGREAVYVEGHRHCDTCGHVHYRGHWYERD
ncbi:MAG: hypothetical protein JO332_13820 [Planctomycetaceae bacterium]|nr:hypothetical protein [Planctomycetaceae bacterium]